MTIMNKEALESEIKAAFEGVRLDKGMSLRQAYAADDPNEGVTAKQYQVLPRQEITYNWTVIPADELQTYCHFLAHLDAKGFRYYLPAMMVNCLNEASDVRGQIIYYLSPTKDSWDGYMKRYSLLNQQQRSAVAHFLYWYPGLADIRGSERKVCKEAVDAYWHQYLTVQLCPLYTRVSG